MIVRVQVRLDRIDVDLSAERLVVRLLETNNSDSHSEQRDSSSCRVELRTTSTRLEALVRLSLPAELKRTGKEMKFVIHGDGDERTADPSLVRLIVRARGLARRLAENPGWTLEDVASQQTWAGLMPPADPTKKLSCARHRRVHPRWQTARRPHRQ